MTRTAAGGRPDQPERRRQAGPVLRQCRAPAGHRHRGPGHREPSLRARQARDPRRHRALLQTRGEPPAGPVAVLLPGGTRLRDHRRGRPAFPGRGTARRGRLRAGLPRPGRDRRGAAPGRPGQLLPAQLARRDRAGRVALRTAPLGRTGSLRPLGRGDHGGRGADRPRHHGPLAAGGVRLPRLARLVPGSQSWRRGRARRPPAARTRSGRRAGGAARHDADLPVRRPRRVLPHRRRARRSPGGRGHGAP